MIKSTKVFISWSGEASRQVAQALHDELRFYLPPEVQVWMSTQIEAGARWSNVIFKMLSESKLGILCLTKDNLTAPWLLFEAGFLARQFSSTEPTTSDSADKIAKVIPYRFRLTIEDVEKHSPPLAQLQGVGCDETGTFSLFESINKECQFPKDQAALTRSFADFWRRFEGRIGAIALHDSKQRSRLCRCATDLISFPRGPSVTRGFIPDSLIRKIADEFTDQKAILNLVREANTFLRAASDEEYSRDNNKLQQDNKTLIQPGLLVTNDTPYSAWHSIFEEASLKGPRTLVATLMVLDIGTDPLDTAHTTALVSLDTEREEWIQKIKMVYTRDIQ